jgi:hypothetical protein
MMNLHGIARAWIPRVNPETPGLIRRSAGFTMGPGARQVPQYEPDAPALFQVQGLSQKELLQIDSINRQGILCSVYVGGNYYGVQRANQKGSDLFLFNGQTWKVITVLEAWPDWCKVALSLQQSP